MNKLDKLDYIKDIVSLVDTIIPCSSDVTFFIACQSALETGYGSSELFSIANNLFGMRAVRRRISTSYVSYNHHQFYDTVLRSVVDYCLWLQMSGFNHDDLFDLDKFSAKMRKSNYNPSPKYVDTILSIYKTYYHE